LARLSIARQGRSVADFLDSTGRTADTCYAPPADLFSERIRSAMKKTLFGLVAATLLFGGVGCMGLSRPCYDCGDGAMGAGHPRMAALRDHMQGGRTPVQYGPPSGAVAYPYYTVKGPSDFLAPNPPSIGR
jgi:hypothetical protein